MHDQRTSRLAKGAARLPAVPNYSAARTVAALEQLALRPHSVPELADALNVATRTSRRLLQRLDVEGYVVQERGGRRRRYHLTLRLLAVAAAAEANLSALADANTRLDDVP